MPSGWVHAVIDLIAYGEPYFHIHKEKDRPHRTLHWKHRRHRHDWYCAFGEEWTFDNPIPPQLITRFANTNRTSGPQKAEEEMVDASHDYVDRIWDTLSADERKHWEGFFAWVLLSPETLKAWAGVDVREGKIQRLVDGCELWEKCPMLISKYSGLRNYVVYGVISKDRELQMLLEHQGQR